MDSYFPFKSEFIIFLLDNPIILLMTLAIIGFVLLSVAASIPVLVDIVIARKTNVDGS